MHEMFFHLRGADATYDDSFKIAFALGSRCHLADALGSGAFPFRISRGETAPAKLHLFQAHGLGEPW